MYSCKRRPYEGRPGLYVDNFEANAGSGGDTFGADDIAGIKYPRSKIIIGADGANDGDVSAANPLPVTGTVAVTNAGLTELAGAINGSAQMDVNIAASNASVAVTNAGLTELAAAINASSQMDVNIAASGATVPVSNAGLTELALVGHVDDAAFTAATSSLVAVGGIVTADSVDAGDVGAFAMLANRQQMVTLYDSSGVELSVGGGTQYTEDAAAAANPVGNAIILVREDARAGALTTTDGDNVALRGNNKGEAYVKDTDAAALLTTIDADTGNIATAVQLIDDTVFAGDVAAQAADKGIAVLAVRRDADTTLVDTTGDYANLQVDANGYLKVEIFDGGASHTVDNNGTFVTQIDGNALTALQKIDDPVLVDDAGFTPTTSSVMMAGYQADEGSTDSVDEGDAGAARMTLDRKVITTPQPHTTGGLSVFRSLDLDETEEDVKTSAGQIYGIIITNFATTTRHVKFSNLTAANTTVGSSAVFMTISVPGNTSDDTLANLAWGGMGIPFDTALCAYATTGLADNDTGAPGANDVSITVLYK